MGQPDTVPHQAFSHFTVRASILLFDLWLHLLDSIITASISDLLAISLATGPEMLCIAEHKQKTLPEMHYYLEVMIAYTAKTLLLLYISNHSTFLFLVMWTLEGSQN